MSKTIRYHLFPKTLFKDHNIVPPQQQTQTERIEPDPKPKSVVNKPLIAASQRLRSINSERVLKQFPKFCLNSQQLTVGNPSSLPRMSDSSSRLSRGSVVRCNETMEKSLNELPKKPTHGQKGNSLYNWVPSSLNSLSPSSDGFQPIIILPLASTRHRHTVSRTFKMQAEVIKSCPTQYGGEEKSATSLENYEEKTPLALSDSNSQSQMNNLDVNSSRCDSQCRGSDNTVESSNRSIENEEKQKSASSRTDSENTVTNLNHQFLGQDLIGRNLRIIDNKAKEGLKYRRQSFKPMLRVENEEGISQDISFATPKNNASNDDDKENTVQGDEVAREEGEKTRNSVRCVKGAKDLKKKNSKKNFKIKTNSQRALTSFHKDVMREEVVKPLAEKKKVNQEDALYFLNESSSSDDDMFVEYVKAVKKNDNLDKLRSLQ